MKFFKKTFSDTVMSCLLDLSNHNMTILEAYEKIRSEHFKLIEEKK